MADTIEERYPEHAKQKEVWDEAQGVGQFIDWLADNGYEIAEWDADGRRLHGSGKRPDELIAGFYELDLNKLEQEKRAMLAEMQAIYDQEGDNQ